jgi:hypothetical protein
MSRVCPTSATRTWGANRHPWLSSTTPGSPSSLLSLLAPSTVTIAQRTPPPGPITSRSSTTLAPQTSRFFDTCSRGQVGGSSPPCPRGFRSAARALGRRRSAGRRRMRPVLSKLGLPCGSIRQATCRAWGTRLPADVPRRFRVSGMNGAPPSQMCDAQARTEAGTPEEIADRKEVLREQYRQCSALAVPRACWRARSTCRLKLVRCSEARGRPAARARPAGGGRRGARRGWR